MLAYVLIWALLYRHVDLLHRLACLYPLPGPDFNTKRCDPGCSWCDNVEKWIWAPSPPSHGPYRTAQGNTMFKHANTYFPKDRVRVVAGGKTASQLEGRVVDVNHDGEDHVLVDFGDHKEWIETSRLTKVE